MKYLGTVTDNKDITTKEYVDNAIAASGGGGGLTPTQIVDLIYPVGSTYISFNSTNPNTLFGGTWEQIKDTFLLAAGDTYTAGTTGGSADAVVVSHNHTQVAHSHGTGNSTYTKFPVAKSAASIYNDNADLMSGSGRSYAYANKEDGWSSRTATSSVTPTINSTGVSGTGKNMPPYLAVYMWKRTA